MPTPEIQEAMDLVQRLIEIPEDVLRSALEETPKESPAFKLLNQALTLAEREEEFPLYFLEHLNADFDNLMERLEITDASAIRKSLDTLKPIPLVKKMLDHLLSFDRAGHPCIRTFMADIMVQALWTNHIVYPTDYSLHRLAKTFQLDTTPIKKRREIVTAIVKGITWEQYPTLFLASFKSPVYEIFDRMGTF